MYLTKAQVKKYSKTTFSLIIILKAYLKSIAVIYKCYCHSCCYSGKSVSAKHEADSLAEKKSRQSQAFTDRSLH